MKRMRGAPPSRRRPKTLRELLPHAVIVTDPKILAQLKAEAHHYLGEPAEYLTFWLKPEKSGVRFETDAQRKVETIHAGNSSIQYIEGCA